MNYYERMTEEQKKEYDSLKNKNELKKSIDLKLENFYQLQQEIFLETKNLDARLCTLKKQASNEYIEKELKVIFQELNEKHKKYSEIDEKIQKLEKEFKNL